MELQRLNENQLTKLYQEHMVIDFPKEELKPLKMILQSVRDGFYECLGLFEKEELVGYTFMVKLENSYLIDYIAIFPEQRNKGVGAKFIILEAGNKRCCNKDEVWDLYSRFYKRFLTEERFENNIRVM